MACMPVKALIDRMPASPCVTCGSSHPTNGRQFCECDECGRVVCSYCKVPLPVRCVRSCGNVTHLVTDPMLVAINALPAINAAPIAAPLLGAPPQLVPLNGTPAINQQPPAQGDGLSGGRKRTRSTTGLQRGISAAV